MKNVLIILFVSFCSLRTLACDAPAQTVSSPNRKIEINFCLNDGRPQYWLSVDSHNVISPSHLGFLLKDKPALKGDFRIADVLRRAENKTWQQVWGEEKTVVDHFREMKVELVETGHLGRRMNLIFRAYNDGIGFRYQLPSQQNLGQFEIIDELTEFNFAEDHQAWWIEAYTDPVYEQLYRKSPISSMPPAHTPLTIEAGELFFSIHEAKLTDYSSMQLKGNGQGGHLKADLAPWPDGVKVKTAAPMVTPWRTLQIAHSPGELITSQLILNLNEPSKIADTSWIKPHKFMGLWWGMHLGEFTWGQGPTHGATTERAKAYIDAAVKLEVPSLLIEGWNYGWENWGPGPEQSEFDYLHAYPDFDLKSVADYARERGVAIVGHHETAGKIANYERQIDDAFRLYRDLGITTVKTGYVAAKVEGGQFHYGQYMVRHFQLVADKAAQYGIMVDAHEAIKDTGLRRTYPNFMSREAVRGTEYDAWSGVNGNPPSHSTILPFTRGLAGPYDFTPGIFDLLKGRTTSDRVRTTLAKQLALFVVIYTPLPMIADLPENYLGHPMFKFLKDVPCDWETTRVLNGEIGKYVTIARKDRASEDWYLGSITNEVARNFSLNLDFLSPGKIYEAEIYADGATADWQANPLDYDLKKIKVGKGDHIQLRLAQGGGQAIRFKVLPRFSRQIIGSQLEKKRR
jgi:alpha-glucosidase